MNYAMEFENLQSLQGRKVVLERLKPSMAEELYAAVEESSEELYRFMPWRHSEVADSLGFIKDSLRGYREGTSFYLAIFVRSTRQLVGVIGLRQLDPHTPRGTLSYWICTSMSRQGLGADAVTTFLQYFKEQTSLVRIDIEIPIDLSDQIATLSKCGFQEEGTKRRGLLCHGVWNDVHQYGILLR